jgi:CRP/FNR family transcriptional regulator, cyclic AMP receptor protein
METIDELITGAAVFAGLSPAQLELIAGCGRNQRLGENELLLREGEPADTFFLIRRGAVALELHAPDRGRLRIETLHDGDVVGWSWLFEPYRWQMDARTLQPCSLIAFDGACLRGKADEDHELGYQLMRRFAAQLLDTLQATRFQLLDVYGRAASPA